jgi:hypothetical protein
MKRKRMLINGLVRKLAEVSQKVRGPGRTPGQAPWGMDAPLDALGLSRSKA